MTVSELKKILADVSPDTEVLMGVNNGKVDTYVVVDICMVVPYDGVYNDLYGTPGSIDIRLFNTKSKNVLYLGSETKAAEFVPKP